MLEVPAGDSYPNGDILYSEERRRAPTTGTTGASRHARGVETERDGFPHTPTELFERPRLRDATRQLGHPRDEVSVLTALNDDSKCS